MKIVHVVVVVVVVDVDFGLDVYIPFDKLGNLLGRLPSVPIHSLLDYICNVRYAVSNSKPRWIDLYLLQLNVFFKFLSLFLNL